MDTMYETTVKLPEKFSAFPPGDVKKNSDFAEFSANYSVDKEQVLHGTLHLKTLKREIPGDERTKFSELAKTVEDASRRYIFVKGYFPADTAVSSMTGKPGAVSPEARIVMLEKAVENNPDNHQSVLLLGQAYIAQDRAKDAVALFEKGLAGKPDETSWLYVGLGRAYLALADKEKAFEAYQKAVTGESDVELLNEVAWDLGDAGLHMKEALEYAERAVSAISK